MPNVSESKVWIDTNVLVYAYDDHDWHGVIARNLFDRFVRSHNGVVSVQNLAEFANVMRHRKKPSKPAEMLSRFTENIRSVFQIVPYMPRTVISAISLAEVSGTHFYDALLAATMLENDIATIYTENTKDFNNIPGIRAVNPFVQ